MTVELRPGICTVSLRHPPKVLLNNRPRIPPFERDTADALSLSSGVPNVETNTKSKSNHKGKRPFH